MDTKDEKPIIVELAHNREQAVRTEFDRLVLSLVAPLDTNATATASMFAYVTFEKTGKCVDERLYALSLERLYKAGKVERKLNPRNEWAYWGKK